VNQVISGPNCPNCGAQLHGAFCQSCGQKAAIHLGVVDVFHEVGHEFFHLDGKIFATIRVLFTRPGELTKDFIEGRRTRYIGPLRLYLTFSLLFFFLVAVLPGGSASFLNITTSEGKSSGWSFKADATPKRQQAAPPAGIDAQRRQEIADRFFHNVPRVIFALMPAAALITLAVFRRRQPYFVAHLYYSVHLHAFVFAVLTVDVLLNHAGTVGDAIGSLAVVGIFPYHVVAMRRFFGEPWRRTWWKGTLVTLVYLTALTASMALLVMFSLQGATD
jgi:hypothetical protein